MLRTTFLRIKKVCSVAFIPRILRGDQRCTPVTYAVIRAAPKSTKSAKDSEKVTSNNKDDANFVLASVKEHKIEDKEKSDGNKIISTSDRPLSHQERCQKIINKAFGTTESRDAHELGTSEKYCYHTVNIEDEKATTRRLKAERIESPIKVENRTEYGTFQMSRKLIFKDESEKSASENQTPGKATSYKQNMSTVREPDLNNSLKRVKVTDKDPMQLQDTKVEGTVDEHAQRGEGNKSLSNTQAKEILNEDTHKIYPPYSFATTAKEDDEQLTQKLENIEETPLVEACKPIKIEGFNVAPKVLEDKRSTYNFSSSESATYPTGDFSNAVDEVAKRCLHSPVGKIDEILINELKNLEIRTTSNAGTKAPAIDIQDDLVRINVLNKQAKSLKTNDDYLKLKTTVEPTLNIKTITPVPGQQTEKVSLKSQGEMIDEVSPIASHNSNFPKIVIEPSTRHYAKDVSTDDDKGLEQSELRKPRKVFKSDLRDLRNDEEFFTNPEKKDTEKLRQDEHLPKDPSSSNDAKCVSAEQVEPLKYHNISSKACNNPFISHSVRSKKSARKASSRTTENVTDEVSVFPSNNQNNLETGNRGIAEPSTNNWPQYYGANKNKTFTNLGFHNNLSWAYKHGDQTYCSEQYSNPPKDQSGSKTVLQDQTHVLNSLFSKVSFRDFSLPGSKWDMNALKLRDNETTSFSDKIQIERAVHLEEADPKIEQDTVKAILPSEILKQSYRPDLVYKLNSDLVGATEEMDNEGFKDKRSLDYIVMESKELKQHNLDLKSNDTSPISQRSENISVNACAFKKGAEIVNATDNDVQAKRSLDCYTIMEYENSPLEAQALVTPAFNRKINKNDDKPALDSLPKPGETVASSAHDSLPKPGDTIARSVQDSLPKLNENVALSELLRRVRERNRQIALNSNNKLMSVKLDTVEGKCKRKAPHCSPMAPRSPPNNPIPPPSFGLPMLKRKPPACKPRKKPKPLRFSICDLPLCDVQLESPKQDLDMVCGRNEGKLYGLLVHPSQADLTKAVTDRVQTLNFTWNGLWRQVKSQVETMFARDYQPWVPIPSWPNTKKVEKREPQREHRGPTGCPVFPKANSCSNPGPRRLPKPCDGFPKRAFAMLDCYPVSLGENQVYDLGQF